MSLKRFAEVPVSSYGFAFWWGWIFLLIFNPAGSGASGPTGPQGIWVVSMLSTAIGFAVLYALRRIAPARLWCAPVRWTMAVVMAAATGLFAWAAGMADIVAWALPVGSALGGMALAYFALPWACQFASLKTQPSQLTLLLSFLAAVGLYFLLSRVAVVPRLGLLTVLPLLLGALMGRLPVVREGWEVLADSPWKHRDRSLLVRLSVMAAVSSFMFCIFRELLPAQGGADALASSDIVFALSGLLSIVLLVACLSMKEGIGLSLLFKVALPLVVLGALVFSMLDREDSVVAIASIMTGMRCASLLFWASFVALVARNRAKWCVVFCGGFVASYFGGAVGAAGGMVLKQLHLAGTLSMTTLSIVAVFIMVVAVGWLVGMPGSTRAEKTAGEVKGEGTDGSAGIAVESRQLPDLHAITERAGLTRREAEILAILAQGRTLPYVAEKLYIAPTTVQTHVKHIYQKLGVHNRQELLDYLESPEAR